MGTSRSDCSGVLSRRGFLRLGGFAACALGLGLATGTLGLTPPEAAAADELADELSVNGEGEYAFTPGDALTEADLPAEVTPLAAEIEVSVVNLGGADRYATVAKEALYAFPKAQTAVVASGAGYADSVAAAGLAGALGAPILLTASTYVPDVTLSALRQMGISKIVLLGSVGVANDAVMRTLQSLASVDRVCGSDRYATQMAVYRYGADRNLWSGSNTVVVASATGFADALACSPVSYALKAPVFFCDGSRDLPANQKSVLSNELKAANFILLGGSGVTSAATESYLRGLSAQRGGSTVRLGGSTRYETSMLIAEHAVKNLGFTWDGVAFASGEGPYDSLGGGAVQGKERSVLLLADGTDSHSVDVITRNGGTVTTSIKFLGGSGVVPGEVRASICSKLHVPYYTNTSFVKYAITRSAMATLQVNRNEANSYTYNDYYAALDPDQYEYKTSGFNMFGVLTNGYSGVAASSMDAYVAENCIYQEQSRKQTSKLRNMGATFVKAAQTYGVNECYLLAHAIWESAWGCSDLAVGWTPDKDGEVVVDGVSHPYKKGTTYYNFYGIGAVDSNALSGGRAMAVKEGWTSPEAAILGAAKWINENYLRRSEGAQNTLYLMKWDLLGAERSGSAWHEYCTGLGSWCEGVARLMGTCYSRAGMDATGKLSFSVPVYAGA